MEVQITKYIQHYKGENTTISSKELEKIFQLDGAEVRRIISRLRRNGIPICSSTNGYFYAEKQLEIDRTIQSFNSRIAQMQTARNGLVKSKKTLQQEKGA